MISDLDTSFYRNYYDDMLKRDDEQIESHWYTFGEREGRLPNLASLIAKFSEQGTHLPKDFNATEYLELNLDVATKVVEDWQAIVHYLHSGIIEGRPYKTLKKMPISKPKPSVTHPQKSEMTQISLSKTFFGTPVHNLSKLSSLFDHFDYKSLYPEANVATREECIAHFLDYGVVEKKNISVDYSFDYVFYVGFYTEVDHMSQNDAYIHWLKHGIERGFAPNERVFLKSLGLSKLGEFPDAFDHRLYCALNDGMPEFQSKWRALQHVIDHGIADQRWISSSPENLIDLFQAAADKIAVSGDNERARPIYEHALYLSPVHPVALRHYADCLLRLRMYHQAYLVYRKIISIQADNVWTYLNAITCLEHLRFYDDAVQMAAEMRVIYAGDLNIAIKYWELCSRTFENYSYHANRLALNGFREEAREYVKRANRAITGYTATEKIIHPDLGLLERVVIIADIGLPQCKFYRVEQKQAHFDQIGVVATVYDYMSDLNKVQEAFLYCDLLILYRVPMKPSIAKVIEAARRAHVPVAFEIDDLMFMDEYFPDKIETYGGQVSNDLYASLVTGTESLAAVLREADFSIASTTSLAEYMAECSGGKPVIVHRNALHGPHIDKSRELGLREHSGASCRLFYGTGTKAHNSDFEDLIAPALAKLFEDSEFSLELVIVGYLTLPEILTPYQDRLVQIGPIWDLDVYWDVLAECDINIAVLKEGPISDCKSEIKWMEAGLFGIPSVLTPTKTYQETVIHDVDGLFASTPSEWYERIRYLAGTPSARARIGAAARAKIEKLYSPKPMGTSLKRNIESVLPRRGDMVSKPKILVVNVFFPPQSIGGATRVVADNIKDLEKLFGDKFDIEVFTSIEGGTNAYEMSSYFWGKTKVTGITTPVDPNIDMVVSDRNMADKFKKFLECARPQIVHFHCIQRLTSSLCDVTQILGIPYLITVHDGWWISDAQFLIDSNGEKSLYESDVQLETFSTRSGASIGRMKKLRSAMKNAELILAVSEPFAELYRSTGLQNVMTVTNGVSDIDIASRHSGKKGKVRLGFVGGMSFHKGYHLIKAALAKSDFENLTLLVIDHSLPKGVINRSRWGSTDIVFKPKFPQEQVSKLYAEIDVLLAPSIWPESYGLVTREAILSGLWVIASDRGSIGEDIDDSNGFVIDVSSDHGLISALKTISTSPLKFTQPQKSKKKLRKALDQARDLGAIYTNLLDGIAATKRTSYDV